MAKLVDQFRTMLSRRHIVRAHFWQSLGNYVQTGGGLAMSLVLARLLEPSVFGQFALIGSTIAIIFTALNFSASQLLVSDAGRTKSLFSRVMGMTWLVSIAKIIALGVYVSFATVNGNTTSAIVGAMIGLPAIIGDWLSVLRADLEGRGCFKPNFWANITSVFIHGFSSIAFVMAGWGIFGLAAGSCLAIFPNILIYLKVGRRSIFEGRLNLGVFKEQYRHGLWLWLNYLATNWTQRIDKVMLGQGGGDSQLGYYNRAFHFGPIAYKILGSLMGSATVRSLAAAPNEKHRKAILFKSVGIVAVGGLFDGAFWWFGAQWVVPFLFGKQWIGAVDAFRWLGWLTVAYALWQGMATALLARMQYKHIAFIRMGGLAFLFLILFRLNCLGKLDSVTASQALIFSLCAASLPTTLIALRSEQRTAEAESKI
jgi:teichuronic acid exporter